MALALAALIVSALAVPAAGAAPANYKASSAGGGVVFFTTTEQLVSGDTDGRQDVYVRSFDSGVGDYVTRQVSTGPIGGNDAFGALFERASADGSRAFFSTDERLVAADTDQSADLYLRDPGKGTTTLVSQGGSGCAPACGNGAPDVGFAGATADGAAAFFITEERLTAGDADGTVDIYERDLGAESTVLVSAGESSCAPGCGNDDLQVVPWGISPNGAKVFFTTAERLSGADEDSAADIYARDLAAADTALVSQGDPSCTPGCGNSGAVPVFRGSSADGSRVFFTTDEPLAPGDEDTATDVYARDLPGGPTTLVSAGQAPELTANFAAASTDGSRVFFTTTEQLVGGDTNGATDVYTWSGGGPSLVTSGACTQGVGCGSTFNAITSGGETIVFTTTESLVGGDEDTSADVYAQDVEAGTPTLASRGAASCAPGCGNGAVAAIFNAISSDAAKILFTTAEQLAGQDLDPDTDVYLHDTAVAETTLSSPAGVCPFAEGCDVVFSGASGDGGHVFFQTGERLTVEDVDSESDVYERSEGETRIVSSGNSAVLGPATPVLEGTDPPSPGESTTPAILGQADPNTSIKIYETPDCSGAPVATGSSLELGGAGIAVSVAAGSTTSFRATATDGAGDTSACSGAVSYRQEIPPPPPPPPPPPDPEGESGTGGDTGGASGGASGGAPVKTHSGGIAYVTPATRITFGPSFKTRRRRAVFRFTDSTGQPGTRFICKLDRRRWRSCSSPKRLKRFRRGRHVFKVKAVNAAGAWEARPVKRRFKLVRRSKRPHHRGAGRGRR